MNGSSYRVLNRLGGSLALAACDKSKLERSPSRFTIVKVPWAAMEIAPILKEERLVEDWL